MSQELLYTSAPRGLKPGSRGFCTVLSTQGMPAPLASAVESLSGYRPVYPASDERAARNPVVYSHLKMQATGRTWHVLSRIADYGLDYSQRANKLAHHVILDTSSEQLHGGPANLLSMPGFMREEWSGDPRVVALKPVTREPRGPVGICRQWQEMTGDAGWAGVLAESFLENPERLVILLFAPGQEILPLFAEALSLLPVNRRWDVTFSTYFTGLPTGTTCVWRAMIQDSKEAHESLRFVSALRIDLTTDSIGPATGGDLVEAARSGNGTRIPSTEPPELEASSWETQVNSLDTTETGASHSPPPLHPDNSYRLETGRPPVPIGGIPPKKRSARHLADVIAEESLSAPSRRWRRFLIPVAALSLATFFGVWILFGRSKLKTDLSLVKSGSADSPEIQEAGGDIPADRSTKQITPTEQIKEAISVTAVPDELPSLKSVSDSNDGTQADPNRNTHDEVGEAGLRNDQSQSKLDYAPATLKPLPKRDDPKGTVLAEFTWKSAETVRDVNTQSDIRFFSPHWLTFVDRASKDSQTKADREITVDIGVGEDVVAYSTHNDSQSGLSYALKSRKDDHVKAFGWHRIRIAPDGVNEPPQEIKFADFPLNHKLLAREIKKALLSWPLPYSPHAEVRYMPTLMLTNIAVSIDGLNYHLNVIDESPQRKWLIEFEEFEEKILKEFKAQPDGKQPDDKLKLAVSIDVNEKGDSSLNFRLNGKKELLLVIKTKLIKDLNGAKLSFLMAYNRIKDMPRTQGLLSNKQVDTMVKPNSIDNLSNEKMLNDSVAILGSTENSVVRWVAESENSDDSTHREVLVEFLNEVRSLQRICTAIKRYNAVSKSLEHIKIVAARLSYVVADMRKKSNGPESGFTVDVVNFDETPKNAGDGK